MPIKQQMRYDRSGNLVKVLPDEVKVQVLRMAHERVLARSQAGVIPPAEEVLQEAALLLAYFDQ